VKVAALCCAILCAAQGVDAQTQPAAPLALLDVPFISQSEALCGGAAAAMVLRYWGERGIGAESFAPLVERDAAGIRTDALIEDLRRRGWIAAGMEGTDAAVRAELARGRPVIALIEDRPSTYHYIVLLAWPDRGVVFHDPARAPFLVMSTSEFDRRWRAAGRWMAVVLPNQPPSAAAPPPDVEPAASLSSCDQAIADGIRYAQSNALEAAARTLGAALNCPAALRELAGVRVLQRRWAEAADLAAAALAADARDVYAWKVLATSRFVQGDSLGALAAWNRVGEPRLDLVRVDGLERTRQRVVERLIAVAPEAVLTADRFLQAQRRLALMPSATSTRLSYAPVPAGLAELRAVVVDKPRWPSGRLSFASIGLTAAATRELRIGSGSLLGSGEALSGSWRFWSRRPRVATAFSAPAPWSGVWSLSAFWERQPFMAPAMPSAERSGARLHAYDWATGRLRWTAAAGVDARRGAPTRPTVGAGLVWLSRDSRFEAAIDLDVWTGRTGYATAGSAVRARSSPDFAGTVFMANASVQHATRTTPPDLWPAGDTGHVRSTLLRAHPVLDAGRLRIDRMGRLLTVGSVEAQRWWRIAGPVRAAAAIFADAGRTLQRHDAPSRGDLDVGVGGRVAIAGLSGLFRIDLAKGLHDGATGVAFVYEP
jgi:hypothetical protein